MPLSTDRTLREIIVESHKTALEKGWWKDGDRPILEQLMLMVTELAEATEEVRNGHGVGEVYYNKERSVRPLYSNETLAKPEGFLAELADLFIRVGDTVGRYGLTDQFIEVLEAKLEYNKHRPYRHGGKTA